MIYLHYNLLTEVKDSIGQIQSKFTEFREEMKHNRRENEQEEKHVQKTVDNFRTNKTEIESEKNLKEKERKEVELQIENLRQKIKEVYNFISTKNS